MRISLLNDSLQAIGGGWSFQSNLMKGLEGLGHEIVDNPMVADIAVVSGVTMVTRNTINRVKDGDVKLVVRIDNIPRNSRNRNTGTSRLKEFSERADAVVWQCNWAKEYIGYFIKPKMDRIIYNGVDTNIFYPSIEEHDHYLFDGRGRDNYYLYSRFSRDETKNWEVAWYNYQLIQKRNKEAKLIIVGQFSPDLVDYNFDFFRGENFEYLGVIYEPKEMAKIYRSCKYLIAPYFNDAFSNTYLEALLSDMDLYEPDMSGGTKEMLELYEQHGKEYFTLRRLAEDYEKLFKDIMPS